MQKAAIQQSAEGASQVQRVLLECSCHLRDDLDHAVAVGHGEWYPIGDAAPGTHSGLERLGRPTAALG